MITMRSREMVKVATSAIFALLLATLLSAVSSTQAYAWFNDEAKSYPATQDLGSFGAPINGSDLPNGSYQVTARTTSRMCIMYLDPNNAEARDSKEQAIINVQDGNIVAMFYISAAYTHLFWGDASAAAASTNAEGTDPSAYVAGSPDQGYTPHMFAIPIPALNTPMVISTFSGGDGDKGWEDGSWYTREFVFIMTDAEYQAIINANKDPEDSSDSPKPDPEPDPDPDPSPDPSPDPNPDDNSEPDPGLGAGAGYGTGALPDQGQDEESDDAAGSQTGGGTAGAMHGVRMNIVGRDLELDIEPMEAEEPVETQQPLLTPEQILALAALLTLVIGVVVRVATFSGGYERGAAKQMKGNEQENDQF